MFFYDHEMARDDYLDKDPEPTHSSKTDLVDGLRAVSMFKRDPGPLRSVDINQEVKYSLVSHPYCIEELKMGGFLSESLVRELEQMMKDSSVPNMSTPKMVGPGVFVVTSVGG